jgi:hypothetical protein
MNDEITDFKLTKSHLTEHKSYEFFMNLHDTPIQLLFWPINPNQKLTIENTNDLTEYIFSDQLHFQQKFIVSNRLAGNFGLYRKQEGN